jgi:hypothetical protein
VKDGFERVYIGSCGQGSEMGRHRGEVVRKCYKSEYSIKGEYESEDELVGLGSMTVSLDQQRCIIAAPDTISFRPAAAAATAPFTLHHHSAIFLTLVSNSSLGVSRCSFSTEIRPKTQSPARRPLATVATLAISHGTPPSCYPSHLPTVLTVTQGANQSGLGGGPPGQGGDNKDKKDQKVPSPPPIRPIAPAHNPPEG